MSAPFDLQHFKTFLAEAKLKNYTLEDTFYDSKLDVHNVLFKDPKQNFHFISFPYGSDVLRFYLDYFFRG